MKKKTIRKHIGTFLLIYFYFFFPSLGYYRGLGMWNENVVM